MGRELEEHEVGETVEADTRPRALAAFSGPGASATFMFTDVEGSTRLWAADEPAMSASVVQHEALIRKACASHGGSVFNTAGDSFSVTFTDPRAAVAAAMEIQRVFARTDWVGPVIKVRIGIHLGPAEHRDGQFFGTTVNTAARVEDAAHGGQTLISEVVRDATRVDAIELGKFELRDVAEPIRLFQVGDGDFPPLRVPDPDLSNLPGRPTSLIGRDDTIATIRQYLLDERLVTIVGFGGCGKTRVAIEVGEQELGHHSDGVWFVDLTAVVDGTNLAAAIAEPIGFNLTGEDPSGRAIDYLTDKDALVILDNCEHIIDECAEFADRFLATNGRAGILATSRERLDVYGERVVLLSPLATETADSPAVQLFVDRAVAIDPSFELTEDNAPIIEAVCERLDGLPLAIELAAVHVTMLTPTELLAGLDDRFTLLSGGRRRQRLRALMTTLDWSYDLLTPEEQQALGALGVFVDGFDIDAAAAIVGSGVAAARRAVEALLAKSLVVRLDAGARSRYRLLETVKAYAERRLVQSGEAVRTRDRHLAYFHAAAMERGRVCQGTLGVGERLRRDTSNVAAAYDWAMANERNVDAAEVLLGSSMAYFMNVRLSEYRRALAAVQDRCADDVDLQDYLRVQRLVVSGQLRDLSGTEAVARELTSSTSAPFRAIGRSVLAGLSVRYFEEDPDLFEHAQHELDIAEVPGVVGDLGAFAAEFLASSEATRALIRRDYAEALELAETTLADPEGAGGAWSFLHVGAANTAAMCNLLLGRPKQALAAIEWLDRYALPYYDGIEVRAIVHIQTGDLDDAIPLITTQCRRGLSGRYEHECSDSVLLLAAMAHAEHDDDRAVELLLQMGEARLPATIAFAQHLATVLGVTAEQATAAKEAISSQSGAQATIATLRTELERRAWT